MLIPPSSAESRCKRRKWWVELERVSFTCWRGTVGCRLSNHDTPSRCAGIGRITQHVHSVYGSVKLLCSAEIWIFFCWLLPFCVQIEWGVVVYHVTLGARNFDVKTVCELIDSQVTCCCWTGCLYNDQLYAEGDTVPTKESCLNCSCRQGALRCHLQVCPYAHDLYPPPVGCILVERKGGCCPKLHCRKWRLIKPIWISLQNNWLNFENSYLLFEFVKLLISLYRSIAL